MSAALRIVVSHPSRQGNMYRVPMAAQACGFRVDFLTGLYYRPDRFPFTLLDTLPDSTRTRLVERLERRRLDGLAPASVHTVSGPLPELAYRWLGYRTGNALHDRLAAAWIGRHAGPGEDGVFHGFQESCASSLAAARRRGLVRLLESTLPPSTLPILAAEHDRIGRLWSGPARPSRELLRELSMTDYHVAQSHFALRSLAEYGVDPNRVFLMPLGVETGRFSPAGPGSAGRRPFRALFTGQLTIRKGVHHLLQAWAAAGLPDAELLLAGSAPDPFMRDLVARAPGSPRYLGFVPHARLQAVYREADVFVFPSLAEGGVYVIYEALASGLPCIVSENAGSAVRDGIEGFVVPVGDVEALAARMRQLHDDPNLRQRMSEAARARAEGFSWENFYRRVGIMYRTALAQGGAALAEPMDLFER